MKFSVVYVFISEANDIIRCLVGLTPWPGALALDPAGGSAPRPRYRLALRARRGQGPSTFFI